MLTIGIFTGSTDKGVQLLKECLEAFSSTENVVYARIRYNTSQLTPSNAHPLEYPLCLFTTDDVVLCLADVTAGYGGTGPQGLVELLEELEFDFDENDILERNRVVKLDYLKENVKLKDHFKEFKIPELSYQERPFYHVGD